MAVRGQRQRQFLLRHHVGMESRAVDIGDGSGVRGAEGRVGGREAGGEGQGGEADLMVVARQAETEGILRATVSVAWAWDLRRHA